MTLTQPGSAFSTLLNGFQKATIGTATSNEVTALLDDLQAGLHAVNWSSVQKLHRDRFNLGAGIFDARTIVVWTDFPIGKDTEEMETRKNIIHDAYISTKKGQIPDKRDEGGHSIKVREYEVRDYSLGFADEKSIMDWTTYRLKHHSASTETPLGFDKPEHFPLFIRLNEDGTFTVGGLERTQEILSSRDSVMKACGESIPQWTASDSSDTACLIIGIEACDEVTAEKNALIKGIESAAKEIMSPALFDLTLLLRKSHYEMQEHFGRLGYDMAWIFFEPLNNNLSLGIYVDESSKVGDFLLIKDGIPNQEDEVNLLFTCNGDGSLLMRVKGLPDTVCPTPESALHAYGQFLGTLINEYERKSHPRCEIKADTAPQPQTP